jgi:hypothetical protein
MMTLYEKFVLNGKWWTPKAPDRCTKGEMTFDPFKGAILNLGGTLGESETCPMPLEIVLGKTDDDREITLIGSSGIWLTHPYRIADNGEQDDVPACSSLCANVLIIGKHYHSSKEIDFEGFTIDLSHLSDWAGLNGRSSSNRSHAGCTASEHDIGQFGRMFIETEGNGSCHLTIAFERRTSLDKGIEMIGELRNLMSLLMHRPIQLVRVQGIVQNGSNEIGPAMKVDVLYPTFARDRTVDPLNQEDMLLPLSGIRTEIGVVVAKWYSFNETMAQVLDLYFAASQSAELFPETRFIMYNQAIEAYHRLRYRNFEVEPEEHKKRLEAILSSIPEEYREWMRDGLEYSNEPSHGQRLREIYREFEEIMDEFVDDRKLFIFRIIRTRNHLTHLEGSGDEKVFIGNDLVLATTRLRLLLELCLLKEIGIGPEQMKAAVTGNSMFSRILVRPDHPEVKTKIDPKPSHDRVG